ncbi:hypothetical protein BDR07DRAFT_1377936 [Suillus spraguei]|nr:hypothetical protein BDR07DRAFT_1377936 [Suillus spraguei]
MSPAVDWTADLHDRFSKSFSARLNRRRQVPDRLTRQAAIRERFHALEQRSGEIREQNKQLSKDFQYLVEECQHRGRLADKRMDKQDAYIDRHLQEKKELHERMKVVHAWRKHIRELRRDAKTPEQHDEYSRKLKDGPPPGWKP